VRVGLEHLPPPPEAERRVLARVGAAPDVRLACQVRPAHDLTVEPLLAPSTAPEGALGADVRQGHESEVAVLFADLRGFTRMAEHKLPYDVVFVLNRYFETVGTAITSAGGVTNQFTGDGVMALFGIDDGAAAGCRQAVAAARAMVEGLAALSAELAGELPAPLRIGIGVHAGPAVVGQMGWGASISPPWASWPCATAPDASASGSSPASSISGCPRLPRAERRRGPPATIPACRSPRTTPCSVHARSPRRSPPAPTRSSGCAACPTRW
jgi:class 3 adenylate cyclase